MALIGSTNMALGGIGRGKAVIQQPAVQPGSSFSSQQQNGFVSDTQNGFGGSRSGGGGGSFGGDSSFQNKENGPSSGFGGSGGGFGAESNASGGFGGGGGGNSRGFGGGERRGGGAGGGRGGACHKCGNEGHFARECPESGGGGYGGGGGQRSRACFKCGQEGHRAAECPNAESSGGSEGFGNKSSGGGGFGGGGYSGGGFGGGNSGGGGGGFNSGDFDSSGGGGGFRNKGFGGGRDDNRKGGFGNNRGEEGGGGFGGSSNKGFGSGGDADGESRGGGGSFGRSGGGFGGGSGSGCRKCGEEGHIARNCPQGGGSGCRKCGKEGHIARECPEGGGPSNDDGCRRCGSKDHMVRDCPEPIKCFNCNEEGHQSKDCTKPRATNGEDGRKPAQTYQPKEVTEEDLIKIERIHSGINFEKYDNIKVQVTGSGQEVVPIQKFEDAGFTETVRDNVLKTQWNKPTPIQKYAIPIIMAGHDLMACAQTGSGKTAAYLLPVLSSMLKRGELTSSTAQLQEPSAIIIAPTRELAIQISTEAKFFAHGTMVRVCLLYGGTNVKYQIEQIQRGCNVLVATPGRLNHFISEGRVGLSKCRYVILDEADRMLDMGFESEIRKVVQHTNMPLIADRQTLMFSATFPEEIQKLAQDFLRPQFAFIAIGIVGGANADITQEFEQIDQYNKKDRLVELLTEDVKNSQPNADGKYLKKTLVFVERKRVADFIATYLSQMSFKSTSIHGDREQQQREEALNDFKSGRCPVLIATAVAARGLDIVGVDHVINYDLPNSIDDYVHRIGRTGRVGNPGRATSFFDSKTDEPLARQLVQILADALQTVPEWMQSYAGGVQSFSTERSMYGGQDRRELDGGWNSGAAGAGFGGTNSLPASDKWE